MTFRLLSEDSELNPSIVARRSGERSKGSKASPAVVQPRRYLVVTGLEPAHEFYMAATGHYQIPIDNWRGALSSPRAGKREERTCPVQRRATRPSSLSAQLSHKFKAGRCLPPLSPLAHTRCNRNAMAGSCTDRYNRCSLRPDRPSALPLNFCTTRASMIWSPLHTWVVHLRRSEFK